MQVKLTENLVDESSSNSNTLAASDQEKLMEKVKTIEELHGVILEKDREIQSLKQQVEIKEKELVDKTCAVAKLSIGSALSSQLSKSLQVIYQL